MLKHGQYIIKDLDTSKRMVTFAFAKFEAYDSDDDYTQKGTFKKTMAEQGPSGADRIVHLWNHEKKLLPPIGKVVEMFEQDDAPYARSKMLGSQLATDVLDAYQEGAIKEHSYWGKSYNTGLNERGGKLIKEVKLMEVSTVIWGAQEMAKLVEIKKSGAVEMESFTDLGKIREHLNALTDYIRKGKASDEFMKEIEYEILKTADIIETLEKSGRQDPPETVEPFFGIAELYKLKSF